MKTTSHPHVTLSKDGDIIINEGPDHPVLFLARAQVAQFLQSPATVDLTLITHVGAAAIKTMLAAQATFDVPAIESIPNGAQATILRFRLPNGLTIGYFTDEVVAEDRNLLAKLGVDLAVTDGGLDWRRQHAPFIGEVIGNIPPTPPQLTRLESFNAHQLVALVHKALKIVQPADNTPTESIP